MSLFAAWPREVWIATAFVFGLVIGSFLNVVIHRLPRGASLSWPGSHCPACAAPVRWYDNVPLLSYLWLRARCRHCKARISWRYPAVELVTGLLFAAIVWRHGLDPMTPLWCAFAAALVACAVIDFDHQIIPDEISVGGLGLALVLVPLVRTAAGDDLWSAVARSAGGAALGGGLFWLVGFVHARVSTSLGRRFEHWPGAGRGAALSAEPRLLGVVSGRRLRRRQAARADRRRARPDRRAAGDPGGLAGGARARPRLRGVAARASARPSASVPRSRPARCSCCWRPTCCRAERGSGAARRVPVEEAGALGTH